MLIVLSPSKTHQVEKQAPLELSEPFFLDQSRELRQGLQGWSREDLKSRMKLSEALADQVCDIYQRPGGASATAVTYYTGLVYKQLYLDAYDQEDWAYISDHLRILSAMYGVLKPQDLVQAYRLDFLTKWPDLDLYGFWKEAMAGYWEDEVIVDLSSNEFGKMLPENRIQVQFLQRNKKGQWNAQSTKTKMARGRMVDWMIREKIKRPEDLQAFDLDGYAYDPDRSSERVWVFVQSE
jgi:hypothetical protein